MQTDLLSTQGEENLPQPLSSQNPPLSESSFPSGAAQPAPTQGSPEAAVPALPVEKKRSRLNVAAIGLSFLVFVLLLAVGGVGYWAYTLNTELVATRGQLAALQADHAKLQADHHRLQTDHTALTSEHEELRAELTQSKSDLEKANGDLTAAQADLNKSKDQGEKLETQIDKAGKLAEVLFVFTTVDNPSDVFEIDALIKETKNEKLIEQWNAFTNTPSDKAFGEFLQYLVLALRNSLR